MARTEGMTTRRERILVVDDEESMRRFLTMMLEAEGYEVASVDNGADGVSRLDREEFDLVIADLRMPGVDGMSVLDSVHAKHPDLAVVILTAYGSEKAAAEARRRGAFQLVEKSCRNEEILLVVRNAMELSHVRRQNHSLKWQLHKRHQERRIIGSSSGMAQVFKVIEKVAASEATILIYG
ncbi:MAG: response regulator, partial [Candidatus Eisenbacteria bacterium]|nr:response regulator [Candidatus Eisenbacteria bacterium]